MTTRGSGSIRIHPAPELRDLLPCYIANRRWDAKMLNAALARGDFELIAGIGHNMRGSGSSFGLDELSVIGADIERAAKAGDRAETTRQMRRLEDCLSCLAIAGDTECDARARTAPPVAAAAARTAGDAVDVLLVDDQEMNVAIIGRFLSREGYKVRSFNSGEAALAALAAPPPPGLILLDVVMGGANGLEICRRIKSDPATRNIPVMFVTSAETGGDRVKGWASGADDFLSKPVRREALIERVRSLLSGKRAGARAARSPG